jgi:nitrite reductase (NADH) small subunit
MDYELPMINSDNGASEMGFANNTSSKNNDVKVWFKAARVEAFPENGGACVKYKDLQIAVFNFTRRNEWYACQNMCPHKMQMVLSRGMIGSHQGEPKVACPFHKRTFSLKTGECLNTDECAITVYPVRIEDGYVHIGLSA